MYRAWMRVRVDRRLGLGLHRSAVLRIHQRARMRALALS